MNNVIIRPAPAPSPETLPLWVRIGLPAPPNVIDVTDATNGFVIETRRGYVWRPISVLRGKPPFGELVSFNKLYSEPHPDCTKAVYKIDGYPYRAILWFRNSDMKRVA